MKSGFYGRKEVTYMARGNFRVNDRICLHCGFDAIEDEKMHLPYMYGKDANKTYLCFKCAKKVTGFEVVVNPKTDYDLQKYNNFECVLQYNDRCKSVIETECHGVFCRHYNDCYWCKTKECNNCTNKKETFSLG